MGDLIYLVGSILGELYVIAQNRQSAEATVQYVEFLVRGLGDTLTPDEAMEFDVFFTAEEASEYMQVRANS